jgi:hypothetical protein
MTVPGDTAAAVAELIAAARGHFHSGEPLRPPRRLAAREILPRVGGFLLFRSLLLLRAAAHLPPPEASFKPSDRQNEARRSPRMGVATNRRDGDVISRCCGMTLWQWTAASRLATVRRKAKSKWAARVDRPRSAVSAERPTEERGCSPEAGAFVGSERWGRGRADRFWRRPNELGLCLEGP